MREHLIDGASPETLPALWDRETGHETVRGRRMVVYRNRPRSLAALRGSVPLLDPTVPALAQTATHLTRGQVDLASRRFGAVLRQRGVGPGQPVGIFAANTLEWIVALWGLVEIGAVPVLMNGWWNEAEAAHAVAVSGAGIVIADARRAPLVPETAEIVPVEDVDLAPEGTGPADTEGLTDAEPPGLDEDAIGLILFTSGTTGLPKAVLLPHRAIIARQHSAMDVAHRLPVDPAPKYQRVQLLSAPLFHIGPLQQMITAWLTGSKLVLLEGRFDAGEVLRLIEEERVSTWSAVPTMVVRLLAHPDRGRRDLSSLRSLSVGGARVPEDLRSRIAEELPGVGTHVAVGYGLTEAAGTVATPRSHETAPEGSCGEPLPQVLVRIAEPDGGGEGEILVGGPSLMLGYADQPDQPIDEDGWLHTGDIGRLDARGHLYVTDRAKDIIIRGGENIAAAHVESVLDLHPAVAESAVVSLPHPDLGEEVGAVVVRCAGAAVTEHELAQHAASRLAGFEVPSRWWLRSEPLTISSAGKIDKKLVRQEFLTRLGDGSDGGATQPG
jgi:long-chain acyl-CoA synthetase